MTAYLDHPVLRQMLDSQCCLEEDAYRIFHLYMTLCEVSRVPYVQWHCHRPQGIIYAHTATAAPCNSSGLPRTSSSDPLALPATSSSGPSAVSTTSSSDPSAVSATSSSGPSAVSATPSSDPLEKSTQGADVPGSSDSAVRTARQSVYAVMPYEEQLGAGYLRMLQRLVDDRHRGASLSVVPSHCWSLIGDYGITAGIDDVFCDLEEVRAVEDHSDSAGDKDGVTAEGVDAVG